MAPSISDAAPSAPPAPAAPSGAGAAPDAPSAAGAAPDAPSAAGAPLARLLTAMRVGVHVLFALLLALAAVLSWRGARYLEQQAPGGGWTGNPDHPFLGAASAFFPHDATPLRCLVLALTAALAVCYLVGTTWDHRLAMGRTTRGPGALRGWWLAVVLLLWFALLMLSTDFLWLLFPLVFVIMHVAGDGVPGMAVVAATLVVGVTVPALGLPVISEADGWNVGGLIGPTLGVAFAVAVRHVYRALVEELERQREIARQLALTRARALAAENEAGRLAERERISREIHDTLAQGFNSVVLFSRAAGKALDSGDTRTAAERLGVIGEVAAENLAEARRLVAAGRSGARGGRSGAVDAAADPVGSADGADAAGGSGSGAAGGSAAGNAVAAGPDLRTRLEELAAATTRRFGLPVEVVVDPPGEVTGPAAEVLERVTRESLTNAVRHSGADRARVTLGVWEHEATLDIHDDGHGFDPDAVPEGHFGLAGLRDRAAEAGGSLAIDSSDRGTTVTARIPLAR
ncbi:sensor histidine kinase [Corynebacterium frankenforstense]|uniref:sensor histidine kinase n=1 Tax=Corynebacterium TaxID=1716 RepID=UPI0025505588|nr:MULTISPECIES: sensor histidine kinase [Corynebacterium]MDK6259721.1 sensor histidine kinase [Corynebacterium frankenforstense]MDK8894845.1 sensor histidine kinase [Corynebacterium sp. MSK006]